MSLKFRLALWRAALQARLCCQIPSRYLRTVKFPHPVGIVIGDGVSIGRGCEIYQNVTIGQQAITPGTKAQDYPTIGDDVTIGAGAVVVGAIHIGAGAVIGANAVITKTVPAGATAFGVNRLALSDRARPADTEVAP